MVTTSGGTSRARRAAHILTFALLLLLGAVGGRAGEGPSPADTKMPREPEKPAEAKPVPTVTITEKEYQELRDKAARQEDPKVAEPPSTCKITGQVAGNVAHLTLQFDFHTGERRTRIALCGLTYPTEAKIDGHPALLQWGASGLSIVLDKDKAGDHQLILKLDVPLSTRERPTERGLDLDLPAAVTTTLDLELPPGLKRAEMNNRVRDEDPPAKPNVFPIDPKSKEPYHLKPDGGLGPVEHLKLTWEGEPPPGGETLLNVNSCQITVTVDDSDVQTVARITVGVSRGQLKEVRLVVPPQATIPSDDRIQRIEPAAGPVRTVHLKQPTTEPLILMIEARQPRSGKMPIGPFLVLGAFPQGGDIVVSAGSTRVADWRPQAESLYLLTPRDVVGPRPESKDTLALHYSIGAHIDKGEALPPLFTLEAAPRISSFEAGVQHDLKLESGVWRVLTTIKAQPLQGEPGEMLIRLPTDYTWDRTYGVPSQDVERVEPPEDNKPLLKVILKKRKAPYDLKFKGQYDPNKVPIGDRGEAILPLPMLVSDKLNRGAVVSVTLPDNLELTAPKHPDPFWENGHADAYNKRTWKPNSWPDAVGVAWEPYRPDLSVNSEVRITLRGRQATVSHSFWLPQGQATPKQLVLSVPTEVFELKLLGESKRSLEVKDGKCEVPLSAPIDRNHALVLSYSFSVPERAADPFGVPLVRPANGARGNTRVYVWCNPGLQPELKEGKWALQRTEEVKDKSGYPALVLASERLDERLVLGFGEAEGLALPGYWVDRVLIQVKVDSSGQQKYVARFLLSQIAAPTIDVELPAPLFRPNPSPELSVQFAGKTAVWKPVDETGKDAAISRIARVQIPADAAGNSGVLEINYQLLAGRFLLQTQLQRPQLRGDPGAAEVRWQIVLPPSWVALVPDLVGSEYRWGWRGWLGALRPAESDGDFERWFAGEKNYRPEDTKAFGDPAVVVNRSSAEPLRLTYVPQQPWLMVCSLTLLIVALALAFLSLPRGLFWGTLVLIGVAALLAGLFWPGVLAAILYGCQPGALVLLPFLAVQWLLHRRYRRQVLFLPGFTRRKPGSSMTRGSSRPRGEPSTVDAVPPTPAESGSKKP
jgi:hypothetical protein